MGKKIFISYKYADDNVRNFSSGKTSTVRDYVDKLETIFDKSDNIYKGEHDGEDLRQLTDDTIWEKLKERIYDSSVTIVMISPGMKEFGKSERNQWIPWEVSYSLKEMTRNDRTSHSNAMLAIVLPDAYGSYDYYLQELGCGVTLHKTDTLFGIISRNKFNVKNPERAYCTKCGGWHYSGSYSYIKAVKWDNFIAAPGLYIDEAVERYKNIQNYTIYKEL